MGPKKQVVVQGGYKTNSCPRGLRNSCPGGSQNKQNCCPGGLLGGVKSRGLNCRYYSSTGTPEAKRKRYAISTPRAKKHSPNFSTVSWDKDKFCCILANWPENEIIIWSKVARELGITAKNGGQIIKEFVKAKGFDTTRLDKRKEGSRMRARKLRMPGGEISVPCNKTVEMIKSDWADMIQSGELTLGEPSAPHTLTRYAVINGEIQKSEFEVYRRRSAPPPPLSSRYYVIA